MSVTLPYRGILKSFHRPFTGALAAGASLASGTSVSEVVCVAGCARVRVHLKASLGGTLSLAFVRPIASDGAIDGNGNVDASKVTAYTSGNPTDVTVTADTGAEIHADIYGESYALVTYTYTATASKSITYADVSAV